MPPPRLRYTLLIPTYNRPALLRSLLGYLASRRFQYPIRILDSSFEQALSENRETIDRAGLDVSHQVYDPNIPGRDKFTLGVQSVETPYCSFCPDDDILFTSHLGQLLEVLDAEPSFVAAHGYYVNFNAGSDFDLSGIVYWAPSIAGDDALERIVEQMGNYQAVFYAVFRTVVLQWVLQEAKRATSNLAHELLSSSLTLVAGGVYRHPEFHMGRSIGPSIGSQGWHPHQFLAIDPESLFDEYAAYRAVLLDHLSADERCRDVYTPAQMERVLDLVHLEYLAPMISGAAMDYIIDQSLRPDVDPRDVIAELWKTFATPPKWKTQGLTGFLVQLRRELAGPYYSGRLFEHLVRRANLYFDLKFKESLDAAVSPRMLIRRKTRQGQPRSYLIAREFLNLDLGDGRRVSASAIRNIIQQLDDYV